MAKMIKLLSKKHLDASTKPAEIVDLLLKNRNIKNISEFLVPSFPTLPLDLSAAVKLIKNIIAKKGNILIYGDYDVDGITATAIIWQAIYKLTPNVYPFIPHRLNDGYGVRSESFFRIQKLKQIKFDLLITVDNGIVADHELAKIKIAQNIKIIVADHHLPDKKLKHADAVVHTTLTSGAAVSWFLSRKLDPDADLGLAALGTVADCLPLIGINRSLVVHGLQALRLNPSPGIKKLISIAGLHQDSLTVSDLGYGLGPRINAIGRLTDPTDALRLLCSKNALQAAKYAQSLNMFNQDRQMLQKDHLEQAEKLLDAKNKLIFLSDAKFNPGIIGLIAGRLTEKYYLPTVIIAIENGLARGSCRSIPELNIIELLREYSSLFVDLGGHAGAAGFSIQTENIPRLKKALIKTTNKLLKSINLQPTIIVDAAMSRKAVNLKNIKAVSSLSPFGIGNPEPSFLFEDQQITGIKIIGATGDHLKLKFGNLDAIAFKKGELSKQLKIGDAVSLVASLSSNNWNNTTTPQLLIKEILL